MCALGACECAGVIVGMCALGACECAGVIVGMCTLGACECGGVGGLVGRNCHRMQGEHTRLGLRMNNLVHVAPGLLM